MKQTEHPVRVYDEMEAKQRKLNELLLKLSEIYGDEYYDDICAIGVKICDIYKSKIVDKYPFRHQYHYFIEVLRYIQSPDRIDALLDNLKIVIQDNKDDEFICPILLKLYDHISIDIARMSIESEAHNATKSLDEATKKITKMADESKTLKKNMEGVTEMTKDVHKRIESIHLEIVAILGVFSAIVIGCTGGLDIIGGALSNVGVKDFSLILFSVSLCGMVLFDVLWLLLEFIIRIVRDRKERVIGYVPILLFNIAMLILMCVAFFTG